MNLAKHKTNSALSQSVNLTLRSCIECWSSEKPQDSLNSLWQILETSDEGVVQQCVCEAIKTLVKSKKLTTDLVMNRIVTYIPCCKKVDWLVHLVADLLFVVLKTNTEVCGNCKMLQYSSHYNLWQKPHPFISMINSCPKSSMVVIKEFQRLLFACKTMATEISSNNILQLFKPYVLYVVCNPINESPVIFQTAAMFQCLLNNAESACDTICKDKSHNSTFFHILLQSVSFMADTDNNMHLFLQLYRWITTNSVSGGNVNYIPHSRLFLITVSLCYSVIEKPEAETLALVMLELLKTAPSLTQLPTLSLSLSHLLSLSPPATALVLLKVIIEFVQLSSWKNFDDIIKVESLHLLKVSLLQMVFNKHYVGFTNCSKPLAKCLELVTEEIGKFPPLATVENHTMFDQLESLLPNDYLSCVQATMHLFFKCHLLQMVEHLIPFSIVPQLATILVCSNLLSTSNADVSQTLNNLDFLLERNCEISVIVLPCLLNVLRNQQNPNVIQKLVYFLPKLAGQSSMGPIIRTIQILSQHQALRTVATYVMFKLWEKQNRCFPFLHRMLMASSFSHDSLSKLESASVNSIILRDVCCLQPHKHVGDMLKLSTVYLKEGSPMTTNIVLDAIYHLCANEAVDIMSVWVNIRKYVMGIQTPLVICSILRLFSLIPKLESGSDEFLQFKEECLHWIWKKVESENLFVRGSSLVSLAHFSREDFKVKHIPEVHRPELPPPVEGQTEEEYEKMFLEKPATGESLVNIALSSRCSDEQTQYFLASLLNEELDNLPRDIKHRSLAADKSKSNPAVLNAVPLFMLRMYERNKQPNLKVSYASALLMCYNPQCEVDKAGNLVSRSLVARGRNFTQILQALLSEVTVDLKQWNSSMQAVISWRLFIGRCFNALVESRRTELNLQLKQKSCKEEDDDVEHKLATCELSFRDKLTEILKTASKGSPSMQGNAIYALAGLIHTVKTSKLESEDHKAVNTESGFLNNDHWTVMAANTILSIADSSYISKGRIFSWCQYRSVSGVGELTTSQLGKSCAIFSLHTLVPLLLPKYTSIVVSILSMLHKHHTELFSMDADLDLTINLALGISFGQVLSEVFQIENGRADCEELNTKARECCKTLSQTLQKIMKSVEDGDCEFDSVGHTGMVVGLGCFYSTSLVSVESALNAEARRGLNFLEKLLESSEDSSLSFVHALCTSISWVAIAGLQAKVVDDDHANRLLTQVQQRWKENQSNVGLSKVLSLLSHCMASEEIDEAKRLHEELYNKWLAVVGKERAPTRQKLAAMHGLAGLIGCGTLMVQADKSHILNKLSQVVKVLQDLVKNGKDVGVTGNAILLLGGIYLSSQTVKKASGTFPTSFSYLPESSVLKPSFNFLLNNNEKKCNSNLQVVLASFVEMSGHSSAYPPVNWSPCFSDMLGMNEVCQKACLQICSSGFTENSSLANTLTSWSQVTSIERLGIPSQCHIYRHLPNVVKYLPEAKLAMLLKTYSAKALDSSLCDDVLKGLAASLHVQDLASETTRLLQDCVKDLYSVLPLADDKIVEFESWNLLSECVGECSNCEMLISVDQIYHDEMFIVKSLFVKLSLINSEIKTIDWVFTTLLKCPTMKEETNQKLALWVLFSLSKNWKSSTNGNLSEGKCIEALQEYLGILNSLEVVNLEFMVKALAVMVLSLCKQPIDADPSDQSLQHNAMPDFLWENILTLLSPSTSLLLSMSPWKEKLTGVVIDWLLKVTTLNIKSATRRCLAHALLGLRNSKYYARTMVWTTAVSNLFHL